MDFSDNFPDFSSLKKSRKSIGSIFIEKHGNSFSSFRNTLYSFLYSHGKILFHFLTNFIHSIYIQNILKNFNRQKKSLNLNSILTVKKLIIK